MPSGPENNDLQEEPQPPLSVDDIEHVRKCLREAIDREHLLISNRMGWLLSANAFLFAPIAIMINDGEFLPAE